MKRYKYNKELTPYGAVLTRIKKELKLPWRELAEAIGKSDAYFRVKLRAKTILDDHTQGLLDAYLREKGASESDLEELSRARKETGLSIVKYKNRKRNALGLQLTVLMEKYDLTMADFLKKMQVSMSHFYRCISDGCYTFNEHRMNTIIDLLREKGATADEIRELEIAWTIVKGSLRLSEMPGEKQVILAEMIAFFSNPKVPEEKKQIALEQLNALLEEVKNGK